MELLLGLKHIGRNEGAHLRFLHALNFHITYIAPGESVLLIKGKRGVAQQLLELLFEELALKMHDAKEAARLDLLIACHNNALLVIGALIEAVEWGCGG